MAINGYVLHQETLLFHLIRQLAEADIVTGFQLGRVQLDLLSQLNQAWWSSQAAVQSHLFSTIRIIIKITILNNFAIFITGFGGGGGAGSVLLSSVRAADKLSF